MPRRLRVAMAAAKKQKLSYQDLRPQFFHSTERIDVDDISVADDSGWRDLDLEECAIIEQSLRDGNYGQTQLPLHLW